MQTLSILVVVNVEVALSNGSLANNVWLIDNTGSVSGSEGTAELVTDCYPGQNIQWSVVPVAPTSSVSITGFTGAAIPPSSTAIINPQQAGTATNPFWEGQVSSLAASGKSQYTLQLMLESTSMSFDPYLDVQSSSQS